jgi:hypothetical protein
MKFLSLIAVVLVLAGCASEDAGGEPPTDSPITIDPDVFTYQEDLGYSKETFVVTGGDDVLVVAALTRAGTRFMRVDETGVEHPDNAGAEQALEHDLYTPNYVSDPEVTEAGVEMYLDCKGSIEDPMAETLRKILREELEAAGLHAHVRAVTYDE